MSDLAYRVHLAWLRYRRRHPAMSVPIDNTLSRILEQVPAYRPARRRSETRRARPTINPGVFTMQRVAAALETTVGALLGEPGYESAVELVTVGQRRTLRDALRILRELFDLDDPTIGDGQ